jgi:hypothetical protein
MGSISRSERVLSKFGDRVGLTEDGRKWLITALDPFHDTQVTLAGYPDVNNSASVVQCIKQSLQVSSPTTVATTWDCHIFNNPSVDYSLMQATGGFINDTSGTPTNFTGLTSGPSLRVGGIQVLSVPTNSSTAWSDFLNNIGSSGTAYSSMSCPSAYTKGKVRVIASGLEITNTTNALESQGTVTCYRTPVPEYETSTAFTIGNSDSSPTTIGTLSGVVCGAQPANIAEAMLLPGSRQWKAIEGSYQTHALHSNNIPTEEGNCRSIFYRDSSMRVCLQNVTQSSIGGYTTLANSPSTLTKFDVSGAYFTGLTPQTTFTVTWNLYVERFPSVNDSDLVVIANPSPAYDPVALEIYARAIRDLPVGVPVAENGLGDWFNSAIGEISKFVAPVVQPAMKIMSMVPHPAAQAASMAGKMLAPPSAGAARLASSTKKKSSSSTLPHKK